MDIDLREYATGFPPDKVDASPSQTAAPATDGSPKDPDGPHGPDARSARSAFGDLLFSFVSRMERLEEERALRKDDIAAVRAEAKEHGLHGPTLTKIVKLRRQDADTRREEAAILDRYLAELGMAS